MRITVVGAGYVGLVSGACFADFGHNVTCVDLNAQKIEALRGGEMPIYEPGLESMVVKNQQEERLRFETELGPAVAQSDVVFIAVGTPMRAADGVADMRQVYDCAADIAKHVTGYTVIAIKSTVPVGTGDEVERIIADVNPKADVSVASNPEFLREGAAIRDFKLPDRIINGVEDARARKVMEAVYRPLYINEAPILVTSRRTSEMVKYAANAFLAMKITFINEMADLCEVTGADVQQVARGIGLDNRIGTKFLHAGPGFGGSCFPKDTLALTAFAQNAGSPMRLVETTVAVNNQRKRTIARKVVAACGGEVRGKRIAILGLTFKPNTDDVRASPAIDIIRYLQDHGAIVQAFDPEGIEAIKAQTEDVHFAADPYAAAEGADALVIVTEWEAFRAMDLQRLHECMNGAILVDLRNIYNHAEVEKLGFSYHCVGRPKSAPSAENVQADA